MDSVESRKGCVGGGLGVAGSGIWKGGGSESARRAPGLLLDGAVQGERRGGSAGFGPVAFERALWGWTTLKGRPCAVMPLEPDARAREGAGAQAESLILAQNERWRRA